MKPAILEINEILLSTGMEQHEIDMLIARFLEEEAANYIDCIKIIKLNNRKDMLN